MQKDWLASVQKRRSAWSQHLNDLWTEHIAKNLNRFRFVLWNKVCRIIRNNVCDERVATKFSPGTFLSDFFFGQNSLEHLLSHCPVSYWKIELKPVKMHPSPFGAKLRSVLERKIESKMVNAIVRILKFRV